MSPITDPRFSSSRWQEYAAQESDDAERAERWEYFKPLIMFGVGMALFALIVAPAWIADSGIFGYMLGVGLMTVYVGVLAVIAFPAITLACHFFEADAGPIGLVYLRMLGIYAIMIVVGYIFGASFLWSLIATLLIMSGLVAILFDMDVREGLLVTLLAWGTNVIFAMTVLSYFELG